LAALTDEQKREYRSLAERRVRLGLLLAEVGRANDLNVTPEEMNKALMAEARRYSGQEQAVLDFFRKNAKAREAIAAPILEDKVVDFILEMATVAERKVSAQDLAMGEDATETSQGPATS
jgi:trigger factor